MNTLRNTILAIGIMAFSGGLMVGCGGTQKPAEAPVPSGDPCAAAEEEAGPPEDLPDQAAPAAEDATLRGTDPCGGVPGGN